VIACVWVRYLHEKNFEERFLIQRLFYFFVMVNLLGRIVCSAKAFYSMPSNAAKGNCEGDI
jgi:hypothetical protein